MEDLYDIVGTSRQALHKWRVYQDIEQQNEAIACEKCALIRRNHKRMSSRKIYSIYQEEVPFGRDKFERYAHRNGYKVHKKRSSLRTTYPLKEGVIPNLIEGMMLNGPNQVYQSDIFYVKIDNQNRYVFTIIDVYTKELLVLHESNNMSANELIKAVKKLARRVGIKNLKNVIFHSDRGSQYGDKEFITLCKKYGLIRSMGKRSQQNAYAERVQGTVQYEYLFEMNTGVENLQTQLAKIVRLYNQERPHNSLGGLTPERFAQEISKMNIENRPKMLIYQWTEPILTKDMLFNKKEKSNKKEKTLQHH